MGKDIDAISRDRIISEMNKNFFVEAGAGKPYGGNGGIRNRYQ